MSGEWRKQREIVFLTTSCGHFKNLIVFSTFHNSEKWPSPNIVFSLRGSSGISMISLSTHSYNMDKHGVSSRRAAQIQSFI